MNTLKALILENAKAWTALLTGMIMSWAQANSIGLDAGALGSVLTSLVTALMVWSVANKPQP